MKKIFILLLSLVSISSVFAQSGRGHFDSRDSRYNNTYDNRSYSYDNRGARNNPSPVVYDNRDHRSDWQRQQEIDRINHDYDQRIDGYRRNRSISVYERDRQIRMLQQERSSKLKNFAGGLIVGGLLGVLLSH